jgi:hypothetical protein
LGDASIGTGFDAAVFDISVNDAVFYSQPLANLTSAAAFFTDDLLQVSLGTGLNDVQLGLSRR